MLITDQETNNCYGNVVEQCFFKFNFYVYIKTQ